MPYVSDRDRCESHIRSLLKELGVARRAAAKIPRLEKEIAQWQARILENRNLDGTRKRSKVEKIHTGHGIVSVPRR